MPKSIPTAGPSNLPSFDAPEAKMIMHIAIVLKYMKPELLHLCDIIIINTCQLNMENSIEKWKILSNLRVWYMMKNHCLGQEEDRSMQDILGKEYW